MANAKIEKIKEIFEKNLREALKKETEAKLGDRSQYIGASDVAGCPRAAYLNKINPVELPIEKLVVFERGHYVEEIVQKMMGKLPYKREVEFSSNDNPFPAKVHIDFVLYKKEEKEITLIEVKSQDKDDFTIYPSYLLQVNFQWLVAETALKGTGWKVKNAFILVVNSGSGKYIIEEVKKDENLQKIALEKAKILRNALIKGEVPEGEEQLYCSQCPYKGACPTFCKGAINDFSIIKEVEEILKLEAEAKKIANTLKAKKEALKKYLEEKNLNKVKVGEHIVSLTSATSYKSLDTSKLKKEDETLYNELLAKYGKEIKRASSIKIR